MTPQPPHRTDPPARDRAGPPLQPWLHELVICVLGNATALSDHAGDIRPSSAQGLYVDDRRAVSELTLTVGGEAPSPVAHAALGARAEFLGSARNLATLTPDPTVEVRRHRELVGGGLAETVTITSRAATVIRTEVVVRVGCDAASVGTVKSGMVDGRPITPTIGPSGARFEAASHSYAVTFEPPPGSLDDDGGALVARFPVRVDADAQAELRILVSSTRRRPSELDADPGGHRVGWGEVRVSAADPRVEPALANALTDLRALLLTDPAAPDDVFAGAGTPWYLTLFGRDSIWAARLALPLGTELAGGTLRALARRQGTRTDPLSAEAPGKIPHEVRRFPYVDRRSGLSLPSRYYGTVDATALWVSLLHEAWCWGLPEAEVRDLLPNLEAAVRWLTVGAVADDGLLRYLDATGTGLSNQGWKDSSDAMRFRDGRVADAPIALVEAQAYAVQAAESAARLYDVLGHPGAPDLRAWGAGLTDRIRSRFWSDGPDGPYLGMALDGHGALVDGLGSNMGHVVGTGVLDGPEVARVAATLVGPELLDRYGLRTLARGNGGFNPIGYHTGSIWTHDTAIAALGLSATGRAAEAVLLTRALLAAAEAFDYRTPELYAGEGTLGRPAPYPAACRPQAWSAASAVTLLSVALGLRPDAPNRTLHVHPVRPAPYGAMRVEGLRFRGGRVDLDVAADGTVTVLRAASDVTVEVHRA